MAGTVAMIIVASSATAITICSRALVALGEMTTTLDGLIAGTVAVIATQAVGLSQSVATVAWVSVVVLGCTDRIIETIRNQQREAELCDIVAAIRAADAIAEADNVHLLSAHHADRGH